MNILLIDNSLDHTGASKALMQTIAELKDENAHYHFVFPEGSKCIDTARAMGYKATGIPFREISKRPGDLVLYLPSLLRNSLRLKRIIREEKIDIVHVNDLYNMTGLALRALAGVKVVTHVRRMPESFPAAIYKTWSRLHVSYADHILAVSEANKNGLPPNSKTTVMYDPLPEEENLARFQPRPQLDGQVRILYLANYTPGKGHLHALKMLAMAKAELRDWSFTLNFYGGNFGREKNDEYRKGLEEFAEANGLTDSVNFNNKSTAIEALMKGHDLVLNLSDSESFSRVTLEALFYGVPIIATNVGGTNEMVIEGETGLLAKREDPADMYRAFRTMILDDEARVRMANRAYQFVRERFASEKAVNQLKQVYAQLTTHEK